MTLAVKKITKQIPQTAPLEAFLKSLNINDKAELYMYDKHAYINSAVVLPVLSVTLQWFVKNAESPLHYIKIKQKSSNGTSIYINKYGLTKLLAQSREAVAFALQDYIYELLYTVETKGTANKTDMVSRDELKRLATDLDVYHNATSNATLEVIELKESIQSIRSDYSIMENECKALKYENEKYEEIIKEQETTIDNYKDIANKLARYVRLNSKKAPSEAYDDSLDMDDDDVNDEEVDEVKSLSIYKDAADAKRLLKSVQSKNKTVVKTTKTVPIKRQIANEYTILRSADGIGNEYKWQLSVTPCTDSFKKESLDYMLGDIDQPPGLMLWYCDVTVTDEKRKLISLFLSLADYYNESVILQLLETIK